MSVFVVIFIVGMAVFLLSVAIGSIQRGRRLLPRWQAAAKELGIAPPLPMGGAPKLEISGMVDQWHLSIAEGNDDEETIISYELEGLQRLPLGFEVKAEHRGSQMPVVGRLFSGGQAQVDTGDLQFDQEFIVVGQDPDEVREFLTGTRRRALLSLAESCPKFRLKGAALTYRFDGGTDLIDDLVRPAQAMLDAARVLTTDDAVAASRGGRVGGAPPPAGEVFPGPDDAPPDPAVAAPEQAAPVASDAGEVSPGSHGGVVFPTPGPVEPTTDAEAGPDDQPPERS